MKHARFVSVFLMGAVFGGVCAQINAPSPGQVRRPAERYLLIFDTSAAMKPRAKAVQQTVVAPITSGMQEQLHPGDTIGVWTFNEKLYTGNHPVTGMVRRSAPVKSTQLRARLLHLQS